MIYHKFQNGDRQTVINELYDDEIVTYCPGCGKEMELSLEDISFIYENEGDFGGTSFYCGQCGKYA